MSERPPISEQLASGELPPHTANSAHLLQLLMDPDQDMAGLAAAIELHAVIVGKLIALANSAWSNPIRPVTALDEACARLGLDVVRTLSIALAVGRSFAVGKCPEFDPKRYWMSSIIAADIASRLALELDLDPGTARAAGLLHNIGLLWLADRAPAETAAALKAAQEYGDIGIDARLQDECGVGYRAAGTLLLKRWALPEALIACFDPPPDTDNQPAVRHMSDLVHVSADLTAEVLSGNADTCREYCLSKLDSQQLREEIAHQLSRLSRTEDIVAALVGP